MTPDDPRHGTYAGSTAHYRDGEKPCLPCYAARRKYHTRYVKENELGYRRRTPVGRGGVWQRIDQLYKSDYSYLELARALGCIREAKLYTIHVGGPEGRVSVKTWYNLRDALAKVKPMPTRIGTLRRLQALHALGWPIKHVMLMTGHNPEIGKKALRGEHDNFSAEVRRDIAELYERVAMTLPPTNVPAGVKAAQARAKRRSAEAGWAPPLAWDNIDDPDERPAGLGYRERRVEGHASSECDPVVVMRLLQGDRIPSTRAERTEALRRWVADGNSVRELCLHHGWNDRRYSAGLRAVPA